MTPFANHLTAHAVETLGLYQQTADNVPQHQSIRPQYGVDSALTINTGNVRRIVVLGVGGGGIDALDYMIDQNVRGIECIGVDTDLQRLRRGSTSKIIQLGSSGLGSRCKPDEASLAAIQSEHALRCAIEGAYMVIIVAGLGGGMGTGVAPVIGRIAKDMGILTVGVVTQPFDFEGSQRINVANAGVHALQVRVDALIIIPSEKLLKFVGVDPTMADAFFYTNSVVKDVVSGFSGLVNAPGRSDDECMDLRSILKKGCSATLGVAMARGVDRATSIARQVLNYLLIGDFDLFGTENMMILISTAQGSLTLSESKQIMKIVLENTSPNSALIYGTSDDASLGDGVRVIVLATGSDANHAIKKPAPVGFPALDAITGRLKSGDLVVIGARPGVGKTTLAANIAEHVALNDKLPVAFFSTIANPTFPARRIVGSLARIKHGGLTTESLDDPRWSEPSAVIDKFHAISVYTNNVDYLPLYVLTTRARKLHKQFGKLGLVVVDFLQLVDVPNPEEETRTFAVGEILRGLKLLAQELQCPVMVLSQLSRSVEARQDKRPVMSDLRELDVIEQYADIVMFIYRDDYYSKDASKTPGIAEIIIAKHRNGPIGTVKLAFDPLLARYIPLGEVK